MEPSQSRTSHQGRDRQGVGCFTDDVVGRMGCCMDGMCPESWGRDILSVKKAEMSVPLQEWTQASLKASFAAWFWSTFLAALYQSSGEVLDGCP